jgi:hypothetical protein
MLRGELCCSSQLRRLFGSLVTFQPPKTIYKLSNTILLISQLILPIRTVFTTCVLALPDIVKTGFLLDEMSHEILLLIFLDCELTGSSYFRSVRHNPTNSSW